MILFFGLLVVTLVALSVCHALGAAIVRFGKISFSEPSFYLFFTLVSGLVVLVGVYAIVCTHFVTVLIFSLALLGWLLWTLRQAPAALPAPGQGQGEPAAPPRSLWPNMLLIAGLGTAVFLVQYFQLYDAHSPYLKTPPQDYVFYSRLTLQLNRGIETSLQEALYPQFNSLQPYHYLELWLNALLVRVSSLPSVWVNFISVASVLMSISCVGFMAIFAHFRLRRGWQVALALLFLFVIGVKWAFFKRFMLTSNGEYLNSVFMYQYPKFAVVYVFLLLPVLLLLRKQWLPAGIALAFLPIVYISTGPSAGVVAFALAAYLLLTKQITWQRAVLLLVPVALACGLVLLFYGLQPKAFDFANTGQNVLAHVALPTVAEIPVLVNILIGVFINYFLYYGAYFALFLVILLLRRQPRLALGFPLALLVSWLAGLAIAAVLRTFFVHFVEGFQFFTNFMIPLSAIMLAVLLGVVLNQAPGRAYVVAAAGLLVLIVINLRAFGTGNTRYSADFMNKVARVLPAAPPRGAFLMGNEDYFDVFTLGSDFFTVGNYVSNFKNNYLLPSLSELNLGNFATDPRFQRDSVQATQAVRKSTLYRFARFAGQRHPAHPLTLDSLQYRFVVDNQIGFLCATKKAVLPPILRPLVTAAYTDTVSGERFYLLKKSKR